MRVKTRVKTRALTCKRLDAAVALALGGTNLHYDTVATWWVELDGKDRALSTGWSDSQNFAPSTVHNHGGPILDKHRVCTTVDHSGVWIAYIDDGYGDDSKRFMQSGDTRLEAGLRCVVASVLGDEVDIPGELT